MFQELSIHAQVWRLGYEMEPAHCGMWWRASCIICDTGTSQKSWCHTGGVGQHCSTIFLSPAVLIFLLRFPGLFQRCTKEVRFLARASSCTEVPQPIMNGIKAAVKLPAACKEMLCSAFCCSHVQDYFFSFAECEPLFQCVSENI